MPLHVVAVTPTQSPAPLVAPMHQRQRRVLIVPPRALTSIIEMPVDAFAVCRAVAIRKRQPWGFRRQQARILEQARGVAASGRRDDLDAPILQPWLPSDHDLSPHGALQSRLYQVPRKEARPLSTCTFSMDVGTTGVGTAGHIAARRAGRLLNRL